MRLMLRLLTLALLIGIASFSTLVSPISKADESNPCVDGSPGLTSLETQAQMAGSTRLTLMVRSLCFQ